MIHAPRARTGAATALVLLAIVLIGMALVALAAGFSAAARQTMHSAQDAQLRQLLLAGQTALALRLNEDANAFEGPLDLPAVLAEMGAELTISLQRDGDQASGEAHAALPGRRMWQELAYQRRDGRWILTDAHLRGRGAFTDPAVGDPAEAPAAGRPADAADPAAPPPVPDALNDAPPAAPD